MRNPGQVLLARDFLMYHHIFDISSGDSNKALERLVIERGQEKLERNSESTAARSSMLGMDF